MLCNHNTNSKHGETLPICSEIAYVCHLLSSFIILTNKRLNLTAIASQLRLRILVEQKKWHTFRFAH